MKVIVTGAAGFIGSHVAEALLERGDEVLGIDDLNDYYDTRQKEANLVILLRHKKFSFKKLDIRDAAPLVEAFVAFTPEKVIHLAARAGVRPSIEHPQLYYEVNVLGTLNVLEAMRGAGATDLVAASSSSVYGSRQGGAFSEEDRVDTPLSPYAASKKAMEELCHTYHALHGFNVTCLRFFTVYGPRGRPDMAPYKFMRAAIDGGEITVYGDGSTARDYTYITDIVAGVLAAMERPLPFEVINLGNDSPITMNEFLAMLMRVTGTELRIRREAPHPADVPYTCADLTKAKRLLGYAPTTRFPEGLERLYAWSVADAIGGHGDE